MLVFLSSFILISLSCLWLGFFMSNDQRKQPIVYAINGLIGFTLVAQVFALFLPVNIFLWTGFSVILMIAAFIRKDKWKNFRYYLNSSFSQIPFTGKLLVAVLWLMTLVIGSGPVMMDDTESYHIQMIKWIQEYGSVPGIVNLHERYGFNSSWFSSIALFGVSSSSFNLYTSLNTVLSCWFCYFLVSRCFSKHNQSSPVSFLIVLLTGLLVWPMIRGNASTANYDFITTVMVCILFMESFISKDDIARLKPEWLLWPVFLFTVRIINFPLLLISLFAILGYIQTRQIKSLIPVLGVCVLLFIPFLARNVIVSGYLFYPSPSFDLFSVDWKPAKEDIEQLLYYIKYYNRVSTAYLDLQQTEALGETGWISSWFRYLFLYDKLVLPIGIVSLFAGFFILRKNKPVFSAKTVLLILLIQLIAWLIIGPDPRFVYGCLLCGVFLLPVIFQRSFPLKKTVWFKQTFSVILITLIAVYSVRKIINDPEYRNWISPKPLIQPERKEYSINGIMVKIPEPVNDNWNPRCYGADLPCLYEINPRLEARGKSLKDGFRLKK